MISLLPAEAYREELVEAGFEDIDIQDLSALALDGSETIMMSLRQLRGQIVQAQGQAAYDTWSTTCSLYTEALRAGRLRYCLVAGCVPQ